MNTPDDPKQTTVRIKGGPYDGLMLMIFGDPIPPVMHLEAPTPMLDPGSPLKMQAEPELHRYEIVGDEDDDDHIEWTYYHDSRNPFGLG